MLIEVDQLLVVLHLHRLYDWLLRQPLQVFSLLLEPNVEYRRVGDAEILHHALKCWAALQQVKSLLIVADDELAKVWVYLEVVVVLHVSSDGLCAVKDAGISRRAGEGV